jgi:hypothetical protein
MKRARPFGAVAFGVLACFTMAGRAKAADSGSAAASGVAPAPVSLLAPPLLRGTGRVVINVRPFFNLLGPGWGTIADFRGEYFLVSAPLKLSAEMTPLATSIEPRATRTMMQARGGVAFATQFIEIGFSAGGRFQGVGPGGYSLSAGLRMGALDGLSGRVDMTYAVVRNYYTGAVKVAFSNLLTTIEVPVHPVVALMIEGGVSLDAWVFVSVGIKHHLGPRGIPGTWSVRAGLGVVWMLDECLYQDPRPCAGAAWSAGPTVMLGVDRRF